MDNNSNGYRIPIISIISYIFLGVIKMAMENPAIKIMIIYTVVAIILTGFPQTANSALWGESSIMQSARVPNSNTTGLNSNNVNTVTVTGLSGIGEFNSGSSNDNGTVSWNPFTQSASGTGGGFLFFNAIFTIFNWIRAIFNFVTLPIAVLQTIGLPNIAANILAIPTVILYMYGGARILGAGQ
jgi:hypothetical protein